MTMRTFFVITTIVFFSLIPTGVNKASAACSSGGGLCAVNSDCPSGQPVCVILSGATSDCPGTCGGTQADTGNTGGTQTDTGNTGGGVTLINPLKSGTQADTGNTGGTQTDTGNTGGGVTLINPLKSGTSLESFLGNILDFVIRIGSVVVILMMVLVGFKFVTAQENDTKITEARTMLLWTVIGALVLLGAKVIAEGIKATVQALGG